MREFEPQLDSPEAKELFKVLSSFDKPQQMMAFLRDLLTIDELSDAIRRLQAAKMLKKDLPIRQISRKTKMSSATISRINYWLHHGTGGYDLALDKLK